MVTCHSVRLRNQRRKVADCVDSKEDSYIGINESGYLKVYFRLVINGFYLSRFDRIGSYGSQSIDY